MIKPRIKKPENFNLRSFLHRTAWLFLALLFIVTGLGVGVYAFWVNTHPPKTENPQTSSVCNPNAVGTQTTLPVPETFKTSGRVSQLQTTDLQPGSGAAVKAGDCLTVKYYGTLASNGHKFDENFTTPIALKFKVGTGQVIPGWDQGLIGMKAGGLRRLVIPSALGYGAKGSCETPNPKDNSKCDKYNIEPNTDLVFEVGVLSINQ